MEPRRVIISILTWKQRQLIEDCLESIFATCKHPNYRICVFDQNSQDGTHEYLDSLGDRIDVVHNPENLGFVLGNNRLFHKYPDCDMVLLNDDTVVMPGWLEALAKTAYSAPDIGIVGSKLVYPNGVLQEAGGEIYQDATGRNIGKWDDPTKPEFNVRRDVDYCSGASIYIRRDALDAVGGQFDERFAPAYYEDTDLAFSVRQAGFRVVYEPESAVFHREGATAGVNLTKGFKKYQAVNRERFLEKWDAVLKAKHRKGYYDVPGNGKPKVLVIGKLPVQPDMASGELRLWRALEVLKETHQIVYLAVDAISADRYVRDMEDAGITVFKNDVDRRAVFGFFHDIPKGTQVVDLGALLAQNDFAFVYAYFPDVGAVYLPIVRKLRPDIPMVVDSVDIVFLREWREIELKKDLSVLAGFDRSRRTELKTYHEADRVLAVTEADRDALLSYAPNVDVKVLTNVHPPSDKSVTPDGRSGILFIGGYGHRPNVDAAEWLVNEIMPIVWKERPDIHLTLCGSAPPPSMQALEGERVTVTGWVPETEPYLDAAAVSVAPLRYGAGMKGKVGEALSYGLPVVTTEVGAEGMSLIDGEHVLIADDAEPFAKSILRIVSDENLWQKLSHAGRAHVDARWGFAAVRDQWKEIVSGLTRRTTQSRRFFDLRESTWDFGETIDGSRDVALIASPQVPLQERYSMYEKNKPGSTSIFIVIPKLLANELVPWCEERYIRYFVAESSEPNRMLTEILEQSMAKTLQIVSTTVLPTPITSQRLFETIENRPDTAALVCSIVPPLAGENWSNFRLRVSLKNEEELVLNPASLDLRCTAINRDLLFPDTTSKTIDLEYINRILENRIYQSPQLLCADSLSRPSSPALHAPHVPSHKSPRLAVLVPLFDSAMDESEILHAYAESSRFLSGKVELFIAKVCDEKKPKSIDAKGISAKTLPLKRPSIGEAVETLLSSCTAKALMIASPYLLPNSRSLKGAVDLLSAPDSVCTFSATSDRGFFFWHQMDEDFECRSPSMEMIVSPAITWRISDLRKRLRPAVLESSGIYGLKLCNCDQDESFATAMNEGDQFEMVLPPWKLPPEALSRIARDLRRIASTDTEEKAAELVVTVYKYGRLSQELLQVSAEIYEALRQLPEEYRTGPIIQGSPLRSILYSLLSRAAVYSPLVDFAESYNDERLRCVLRHRYPNIDRQEQFSRSMYHIVQSVFFEFTGQSEAALSAAQSAWNIANDCPSAAYQYGKSLLAQKKFADAADLLTIAVKQFKLAAEDELFNLSNPVSTSLYLAHCYLVLGRGRELERIVSSVQHDNAALSPEVRAAFLKILAVHLRRESRATEVALIDSYLHQLQSGVTDRPVSG